MRYLRNNSSPQSYEVDHAIHPDHKTPLNTKCYLELPGMHYSIEMTLILPQAKQL